MSMIFDGRIETSFARGRGDGDDDVATQTREEQQHQYQHQQRAELEEVGGWVCGWVWVRELLGRTGVGMEGLEGKRKWWW